MKDERKTKAALIEELQQARRQIARLEGEPEQARRDARETAALLKATRAVLLQLDFPHAARAIFDVCADHIGTPAGYLALLSADGERNEVVFLESGGRPCSVDPLLAMPVRGLRELAYREGRAIFDNAFGSSPFWDLMPEGHVALDNVMFAPLVLGGRSVGMLGLANKPGGFTEQDARMAGAFGEIAAIALRGHRTRQELASSEERHRVLFDSSADAIMILAPPSWRFTSGNPATIKMFGARDAADFVSRALWEYSPEQQPDGRPSADKAREMIETAMREGSHLFDWHHQRLDGHAFPASILLTRMELHGTDLLQATVRDMTEYRSLQAQIAQSDRLASMGMLAAGVAHEINNPLSYALYNLQSLIDDLPQLLQAILQLQTRLQHRLGPDEFDEIAGDAARLSPAMLDDIRERLDDALGGAHRISDIARGLGTFSRVERDELVAVDPVHVIEVAISMAFNEIKYRARLVKDLGKVPPVTASEARLSQVFLNLIINAAHAIDEGDAEGNEIRVRTWAEGGEVCAEVRDTGKGIAPADLDQLFEPFFTTKKTGSGLGLAISKNIVESFGGRIQVRSELGKGTSFTIRLPARTEEVASVVAPPVRVSEPEIRGRILIVDDEDGIRRAMVRMLRGHDTVDAASGAAARRILEQDQAFDLVLCDMVMPEVSGMDLHEWLTAEIPRLARQFVFITGGAFTPRAREYLGKVDNIRLEKPFDMASFKRIVGELVRGAKSAGGAA